MYLSNGILKYFPLEGAQQNRGWLILDCEVDLSLYYCWFVKKRFGIKLQRPMHGFHISIVRGEVIPSIEQWNAYQGQMSHFYYSNQIGTNGKYWWLDVYSPCLVSIRQELGLESQPEYDLHLTIGVFV
ncbi:MAG: hypothetical protein AB1589_00370 [Cyanobacteriota bacterium]